MTSVPVPASSNPMRPVLPNRGRATVKSVLSGDTVVLLGRATVPGGKLPEVLFTFERVSAPRMASKANQNMDDPGAFDSREWLRSTVVGKSLLFETRKQGATAGDRVYGLLFMPLPSDPETPVNLAVESVRCGYATPKVFGSLDDNNNDVVEEKVADDSSVTNDDGTDEYDRALQTAFLEAKASAAGVHAVAPSPLVREVKNSGDDFETKEFVESSQKFCSGGMVKCVIEHIFDGSRYRMLCTDDQLSSCGLLHASFTLILAGIAAPRIGNPRLDPPTISEPYAESAKQFVELRLLHRELLISLHGTDKSGVCAVGTVHHPKGNIGVELLKLGYGRVSDWSARMMNPLDVPAFRIAETGAKSTNKGVWVSYAPPQLVGASEIVGTVIEVLTGDTVSILPQGEPYDSETKLKKISLASVRSPRAGNANSGKPDDPFAFECKDRLRVLTVGKLVKVSVHYERDIPMGQTTENRQFGSISVGKREDIAIVLVAEGLAETQRHRDDDEKSPRYDELCAAENAAKLANKGIHSTNEYGRRNVNDLTDPRKAKAYSGSLMRAGTVRAIVEFVFNGSRFKLLVPGENCHIVFALEDLRCPQPSPSAAALASRAQVKSAEPYGDESKRHARMSVLQRSVEILCKGVTGGGVITGKLFIGAGGQRREFGLEQVGAGFAMVDQRKIDYGEASNLLIDAQSAAQKNRVGLWSLKQAEPETKISTAKSKEAVVSVTISEIRSGRHFFFQQFGSEASKVIDESMKLFTKTNGLSGGPCDVSRGKVVAALFNDGSGKTWYRAKIMERKVGQKVLVLFVDYGNTAVVPVATHLRPLDSALDVVRIPPVAKEAQLALIQVRSVDDDDGVDAARLFSQLGFGKKLAARIHCAIEGKLYVTLLDPADESGSSINEELVSSGLALSAKKEEFDAMSVKVADNNSLVKLSADVAAAQDLARKNRIGMWRYGDIGEEDEE